ncbi:hypothetical protein GGH99_001701 [Coemansia sp. RSA 1285]|nr:hypothetical protein GGH99_001701 [Coemansia sp. RSA 1285]
MFRMDHTIAIVVINVFFITFIRIRIVIYRNFPMFIIAHSPNIVKNLDNFHDIIMFNVFDMFNIINIANILRIFDVFDFLSILGIFSFFRIANIFSIFGIFNAFSVFCVLSIINGIGVISNVIAPIIIII